MLARNSSYTSLIPSWSRRGGTLGVLLVLVCVLTWPRISLAQLDICGCADNPNSLGAFVTSDETTYPPGTTRSVDTITIPLPADGILIFDSFTVDRSPRGATARAFVRFAPNQANTPVTILVKGDVTIANGTLSVNGSEGTQGLSNVNGIGGLGGHGGFRGGDGAYQQVNFADDGGAGFGPGGGAAGTASPFTHGGGGTFVGVQELLPLHGGSGGGGGASASGSINASGGGGGGGGGAILIAANGTIAFGSTASIIRARGGGGAGPANRNLATAGGGGSGGAIRLVANAILGSGFLDVSQGFGSGEFGTEGAIRLEAFTISTGLGSSSPPIRSPAPGPLSNPLSPTVAITAVNGQTESVFNGEPLSELPQGVFGLVDVILPISGVTRIDLATAGVPTGTTVKVTAKPRVDGGPVSVETPLDAANCDAAGNCVAAVEFDLAAGAFVIEAQATFQTPAP